MSVHSSLRRKSSLVRHRNVLTRAERITRMQSEEIWTAEHTALGLPKVGNRKIKAAKKKAKGEDAAATPAAGAAKK